MTHHMSKGTDNPFYQLMMIGGEAVLKFIGVESPGSYKPKAIVLKETTLYPDIMALPEETGDQRKDRVFIEFHGYKDAMIRYRLAAKIELSCAQDRYTGPALGAIIFTDRAFQKAAEPLNIRSVSGASRISGEFREIVLSDYTEQALVKIDPRLIILAPFTIPKKTPKKEHIPICQNWNRKLQKTYEHEIRDDIIKILGLFILNRFRKLSLEEVIVMLNFDLTKTRAGRQLVNIGIEKGEKKGEKKGKKNMVLSAAKMKWGLLPKDLVHMIHRIQKTDILDNLMKKIIFCDTIEDFKAEIGL